MSNAVETLRDTKVGECFANWSSHWHGGYALVKVEKITDKQVIVGNCKYRKDDARPIGHSRRLYHVTDDILRSVRREKLIARCRRIDFGKLSCEQLEAIAEITKEAV